jgi:hypothetical protein
MLQNLNRDELPIRSDPRGTNAVEHVMPKLNKILLVDDDADLREALAEQLS